MHSRHYMTLFVVTRIDFFMFNSTFSNISAISWRPVLVMEEAWREPPTTLFCNLQPWVRTHAVLAIGLYELYVIQLPNSMSHPGPQIESVRDSYPDYFIWTVCCSFLALLIRRDYYIFWYEKKLKKQISHFWNGSKNKYHTIGTVPKTNITLLERFQNLIEKS